MPKSSTENICKLGAQKNIWDLKGMHLEQNDENYMRNFMVYSPLQMLLQLSNEGG
jgi:hypothetical protein